MSTDSHKPILQILLVEDNENDGLIMRRWLEQVDWSSLGAQRFELKWVASYEEGLRQLQQAPPDMALVDYYLGPRNGVELLLEARSHYCHVPIVILTGRREADLHLLALRQGAAEFLQKDQLSAIRLEDVLRYLMAQGRAETALRKAALNSSQLTFQNELLAAAVSNLSDGIVITDPRQEDNPIIFANPAFCDLTGYEQNEILGRNCRFLQGPGTDATEQQRLREAIAGQRPISSALLNYRKDGSPFWNKIKITPVFDEAGQLSYFVGMQSDINRQKQDEQAIRDTEARFQSIVANTPGMVYRYVLHSDGSYEFPFVSEGCRELLEWDPQTYIDRRVELEAYILDAADRRAFRRSIAQSASTLQPWSWEGRIRVRSGKIKWVQGNSRPQRLPDGATAWDGLLVDITERKRADTLLADLSHTLEMVARGVPLSQTLEYLCLLMEKQLDGAMCSVLLLSENGRTLRHGAGPSLPNRYNQAIDGVIIGPSVGSCGTAAYLGQPVIVTDISKSPLWADYIGLAASHGLNACWSHPICDANQGVLGTFAVYFKESRQPLAEELQFIGRATAIAAIALERQKAEAALRRSNDELELRVEERTAQLEQAKEDAETATARAEELRQEADLANAAKSEFLSRMSHELRTPLNAILGFSQILEMRDLGAKESVWVDQILRGGRHLLNLINEVLDITSVEAGNLELSLTSVSLADMVTQICDLLRPLAAEAQVSLSENIEALLPYYVQADAQKLKQVLINLVANAIKYNRPHGTVTLSARHTPHGTTRISVHDTGPGISASDLLKLFTPFERLGAINTSIQGTGLGLVLSRRLVEAMDGTLEVESVVGQGSVFSVELPDAQGEAGYSLGPSEEDSATGPAQGQYCLLCIEDNLSNMRLIETILEERPNVSLLAAMQGSVGLDLARQHIPDLILLDLNLPDIDGKEVLHRLRQSEPTSRIPVVIISADASPAQQEIMLQQGALAYLTKPLDVLLFLNTIDDILDAKGAAS